MHCTNLRFGFSRKSTSSPKYPYNMTADRFLRPCQNILILKYYNCQCLPGNYTCSALTSQGSAHHTVLVSTDNILFLLTAPSDVRTRQGWVANSCHTLDRKYGTIVLLRSHHGQNRFSPTVFSRLTQLVSQPTPSRLPGRV